jgi:hypothetical protein
MLLNKKQKNLVVKFNMFSVGHGYAGSPAGLYPGYVGYGYGLRGPVKPVHPTREPAVFCPRGRTRFIA